MSPSRYLQTYNITQLERIASEELKKLHDLTIPIDIERIVEEIHDIEIDVKRGLKEIHHILGMIAVNLDTKNLVILIDETLMDLDSLSKYRMTIAEEFAHILLHKDAIEKVKNIEDFKALQNHPNWHEHDRNAKWLAAALLMPARCVLHDSRKFYRQIVSITGFGDPKAVKKYIRNLLADKYSVSVSAMNYRIENWPIKVIEKVDRAMQDKLDFLD